MNGVLLRLEVATVALDAGDLAQLREKDVLVLDGIEPADGEFPVAGAAVVRIDGFPGFFSARWSVRERRVWAALESWTDNDESRESPAFAAVWIATVVWPFAWPQPGQTLDFGLCRLPAVLLVGPAGPFAEASTVVIEDMAGARVEKLLAVPAWRRE
ncbi:MAG: hypothetical protein QM723_13600 [Myxococcaceae bacterium]